MLRRLEAIMAVLLWPCRPAIFGALGVLPLLFVGLFLQQLWLVEVLVWYTYGFCTWGGCVTAVYALMVLCGHREGGL
jgi:hypothetical protein